MRGPATPGAWTAGHHCEGAGGRRLALVLLRSVALYAFAGWVYIALVALVHPRTLVIQLTHISRWPHEDSFGELCFVLSFVCFTAHAYLCRPRAASGSDG